VTDYGELKIRIERGDGDVFRVFASGMSGEAAGEFQVPFSDLEVENFVLRMGRSRSMMRRAESPEMRLVTEFGGRLFDALFQSRVRDLYRDSISVAKRDEKGLRVTLALTGVPELMHLPWEYLYDDPSFLSISTWTPVVRYLELPRARRPLKIGLPLRILAMVSSPVDAPVLDVERERQNLEQALGRLAREGAVEITWLEEANLRALQRALRQEPYHVFHYIGHGAYDSSIDDGVLLLEDERGLGRRVTGTELGTMLADHTSLRLAVLNACEGARVSNDDPFAGVASSLVQREIPAVIAMQFEITDRAAIIFAGELYAALADGYAVDSALAEARKAIYADHNDVEWGTPVLFMRVPDGRIFDLPERPHAPALAAVAETPPEPAVRENGSRISEPEPARLAVSAPPEAAPAPAPPSGPPRRRRRIVVSLVIALGAVGAAVGGTFALSGGSPPTAAPTTTHPSTTTVPKSDLDRLRASIPPAVRHCDPATPLQVPAKTDFLPASVACPRPGSGVRFAQYSLAATEHDLTTYFNARVNAQHTGANKVTQQVCNPTRPAGPELSPWIPVGGGGHAANTTGNNSGRVFCYRNESTALYRIEWIDKPHRIYVFATGTDWSKLFRWWSRTAGPVH
jgi:CHAT domain